MGQPVDLLGVLLGQEQDQTLWLVPAPPSARKGDNLCCKSKKPTVLQWSVPELCCIDFRQSVKVAQGLRIVRAKLLQVWPRGWLGRRRSVQGRRCSATQGRNIMVYGT